MWKHCPASRRGGERPSGRASRPGSITPGRGVRSGRQMVLGVPWVRAARKEQVDMGEVGDWQTDDAARLSHARAT